MTDLTTEEFKLTMLAKGESRSDTINNIYEILVTPELDEDYRNIGESAVGKLDVMSDEEYILLITSEK